MNYSAIPIEIVRPDIVFIGPRMSKTRCGSELGVKMRLPRLGISREDILALYCSAL